MNDKERNYSNTFSAVADFGIVNAADFPARSAGAINFALIGAAAEQMKQAGAAQISGAGGQATVKKSLKLDALREDLRAINRTARALAVDDAAVGALFRLPHGGTEQKLLATARAFLKDAEPLKDKFISYGLSAGFLEDLQFDIDEYDLAAGGKLSATGETVSATAAIGDAVRNGLEALRRLRAIVPNVYRDNPAKLAAWTTAGHVERTPKKKSAAAVFKPDTPQS